MATSHIPVILLTARGDLDSTTMGYKLGADAYLAKPFDMELLLAVISNQLKTGKRSGRNIKKAIYFLRKQPLHRQTIWTRSSC